MTTDIASISGTIAFEGGVSILNSDPNSLVS